MFIPKCTLSCFDSSSERDGNMFKGRSHELAWGYLKLGNKRGNSLIYIMRSSTNANAPHKKRRSTAKVHVSKV
jgi:hypothetical protein